MAQESLEHACLPPVCSGVPTAPIGLKHGEATGGLSYSWFGVLYSALHVPLRTHSPLSAPCPSARNAHTHTHTHTAKHLRVSREVSSPGSASVSSPVTRGCGIWRSDYAEQGPAYGPSASLGLIHTVLPSPPHAKPLRGCPGWAGVTSPTPLPRFFGYFLKFIFNWRITALQSCVGFCCTTM